MFKFARPEYLYLLLLIPVMVAFFYYSLIIKSARLKKIGNKALLAELMPEASHWRPRVKFYLSLIALTLTVFIMAGPQFGSKLQKVERKGIEIMIAVDVSNSMLAQDAAPDRMSRAKQILSRLIDSSQDDKVGLLVFAGGAYVQMPMTTDIASAKMFLSRINPGMVPVQGTSIGEAIRMSEKLFSKTSEAAKVIVVITDGEDHEQDAIDAAKSALENGITVNVLGVGTPQGSPIPIAGSNNFKKDRDGNVVVTKLNEAMCKDVATAGGGVYVQSANSREAVRALKKELNKLDKTDIQGVVYSEYNEQYIVIAWFVLFLLVLEVCLRERKNSLFKGVKLF